MSDPRAHCPRCNRYLDLASVGSSQSNCPQCGGTVVVQTATQNELWFYVSEGKKAGPVPLNSLQQMLVLRQLSHESMVLKQGTTKWITLPIALGLEQPTLAPTAAPVPVQAIQVGPQPHTQPHTSQQIVEQREPSTLRTADYGENTHDHAVSPSALAAGLRAGTSPAFVPPRIPGYEILGELGRGGMGVVYKARHVNLNRIVALKMILGGGHLDPQQIARFRSEAEAVARFQHGNIIQIFEISEFEGAPFCALEYVEGGTLEHRLKGTPLPGREAAQIAGVLANALQMAHQQNIVHRDLKPANVLLGGSPETPLMQCTPKLSDFGLVKRLDNESGQTHQGAIVGTPSYMSPEQAMGQSDVGPLADVYGLGAILYQLLTGKPPFRAANVMETLEQVRSKDPVPPREFQSGLDRDVETICLKCLEKDPAKRYVSAGELAQDLSRYLHNQPIVARRASWLEKAVKFSKRNPLLVGFSTVVTILLTITLFQMNAKIDAQEKQIQKDQEIAQTLQLKRLEEANVHRRSGNPDAALQIYKDALKTGRVNVVEVKYKMALVYVALGQKAKVQQITEELLKRPDIGNYKGRVMLLKADTLLDKSKPEEAFALMRESLKLYLPDAQKHYAQALLAPTTPEAIRHFKLAVEKDHLDYSARAFLATSLMLTGRLEEAYEVTLQSETLFKNDPGFKVLLAMLLTMQGREIDAEALLKKANNLKQLSDGNYKAALAALKTVKVLPNFDNEIATGRLQSGELWSGLASSFGVNWVNNSDNQELAVLLSTKGVLKVPPVVNKSLVGLTVELAGLMRGKEFSPDAGDRMRRALKKHPEGLLWLMYGSLLMTKGEYLEAERALMTAVNTPSMAKIRRTALLGAMRCEFELLTQQPPPPDFILIKKRAYDNFLDMSNPRQLRAHEMNLMSTMAKLLGEINQARAILEKWEKQAPGNLLPIQEQFFLEREQKNYALMLKIAEKAMAQYPQEPVFRQWKMEAEKLLREEAAKR